jgi:hypothetical protein
MKRVIKSLSVIVVAAFALLATACNKDAEAHYFGEYSDLKPGLAIYNATSTQQLVSLDPAAVAIRLAMLLDEAASKGVAMDEVEVQLSGRNHLLKDLLFGRTVKIEALVEEGEISAPEEYRITYVNTPPASLDRYCREGSYLVATHGVSLAESSAESPWSVTPVEPMYLYAGLGDAERFMIKGGVVRLYATAAGSYAICLWGMKASFEVSERFASAWSGEFTLTTSTPTGNFAFSNHDEDTYALWGEAEGRTFYAFDNRSTTHMHYRVEESDRLKWEPSKTGLFSEVVSGVEHCRLTHPEEYSAALYPSPEVTVSHTTEEGRVTRTLLYNGLTMPF